MSNYREKPKKVRHAIEEGNESLLSKMGRKGGHVAARNRAEQKAIEEDWELQQKEDLAEAENERRQLYTEKDGDVLPPEPTLKKDS